MEHRVIMHTLILTLSYQPQRWFKWSGRTNCDLRWGGRRRRRRRRGGDSPCLPSHWCHTGLICFFLLLTDLYRLFWCRRQWTPPMWRDTASSCKGKVEVVEGEREARRARTRASSPPPHPPPPPPPRAGEPRPCCHPPAPPPLLVVNQNWATTAPCQGREDRRPRQASTR